MHQPRRLLRWRRGGRSRRQNRIGHLVTSRPCLP